MIDTYRGGPRGRVNGCWVMCCRVKNCPVHECLGKKDIYDKTVMKLTIAFAHPGGIMSHKLFDNRNETRETP